MVQININITHAATTALVAHIMSKPATFTTSWSGYTTCQTTEETLIADFYAAHEIAEDADWFARLPTDMLALANAYINAHEFSAEEVDDISEAFCAFTSLAIADLMTCHLRESVQ